MTTLFLVVFLDLIGFGMIIPVFPFYAEQVGVSPASVIFFLGLYSLGQLLGAPVWGAASDRVGRRPILLATLLANAAASVLLATSTTGTMLAISRFVAGVAAGNISTAYAYMTDITTEQTRPKALGLLGAAFGMGFVMGPAFGGLLAGSGAGEAGAGLALVAYGSAVMSVVAFVLTLVRLPESLPPEQRATRRTARAPMHGYLRRPVLGGLLAATTIIVAAVALLQTALAIWSADRLGVGPRTLGYLYGFMGLISAAIQGGATGWLTRRFGAEQLTRSGALLCGVGLALVPFTGSLPLLLGALAVFSCGSALFNPSMSGLIAGTAAPHERGGVLGAYQAMASLGRVLGPFAGSALASAFSLSAPFAAGAVVALGGMLLVRGRGRPVGGAPSAP